MKIYAINGSPRKVWNSAQLLEKFVEGIRSVEPDAEVEFVHVYDYNYTGCRSCFACKLKRFEDKPLECRIKDDIHDILDGARNSDGIVIASPIYFFDLSAQVKAFLERLMYPGGTERPLPSAFIYTMNATEELMREHMYHHLETTKRFMTNNFKSEPDEVFAFDTLQRNNNHLYKKGHTDMDAKEKRREVQFPIDLQNAFDAGVRLAYKIKENK